jgi:flavin reductase (DIM6/NTAB) family NADH-FMN oxidoreductase RutF
MRVPVEPRRSLRLINHGPTTLITSAAGGRTNVMAAAVGDCSGRDLDKFATYGIKTAPGSVVGAPLVEGCVGWLECRVIPEPSNHQRYDLFVAEVVAAWADDEVFVDGDWRFTRDEHRTIHHLSRGAFFTTGQRIQARRRS